MFNELDITPQTARKVTKAAMKNTLSKAVETSQRASRVDTGYMRRNIVAEPVRVSGDVITGKYVARAEYSSYNEYGTYKMSAQPFMRPGTAAATPFFFTAVQRALNKAGDFK